MKIDGFTINDILETDYYLLIDILNTDQSTKEEVMSLEDFVKSI